jgi:predicted transcriptional regulator
MRCQKLAKENNKQSWIPLLKTWVGVQYMYDKQPFTMSELCDVTGLSPYQIRESKKILEKDLIFTTSKAYISYDRCIGSNVDINGICPENQGIITKARL